MDINTDINMNMGMNMDMGMDMGRTPTYAASLSGMVRQRTVSCDFQQDFSAFTAFRELLIGLFPALFTEAETELVGASLVIKWRGRSASQPVMFMNHQDVVPAEGNWSHAPFGGEISEGKIWGRGVLDDKGGLFAMLQAADELIQEGFVPASDVWFVSSCCEEVTTDRGGCREIAETFRKRGMRFAFVLDEGGMIVKEPIPGVKATCAMVGVAERGCADLRFTAKSEGGHSSVPPVNTPLVRLGKFMAATERRPVFRAELSDVTAEMFIRLSKSMNLPLRLILSHPVLFRPLLIRLLPLVSPTAGAMLRSTIAFTRARGSEANNVLPQEACIVGNLRFSHHQGREGSIDAISRLASRFSIETEVLNAGEVSGISSWTDRPFTLIEEAVSSCFNGIATVPYIQTGASDSRFMCAVSDNVYRFVPLLVTNAQIGTIHGIDENLDISALGPAVDFYRYLYRHL